MHRPLVYTQEQPRSADFLYGMQQAMVGLGQLAQAVLGSGTLAIGLGCTPTSPASLSVQLAPGQIYATEPLEATAYGSLPADTTDTIVKQGILLQASTLNCPAPATAGYSINYLIEATYQDLDTDDLVLPYFNSANPSQPLSGQNNSGAAQPTQRQGTLVLTAKAGAAATTGSQTTPGADAGYVGLYVVTVANGQTQITSANISAAPGAPLLSSVMQALQGASTITAADTGAANAYAITLAPAPSALTPGMMVAIDNIVATNTGGSTLNVNGLGALPIQSAGAVALQGGELAAGYGALLRLNHAGTAWTLLQTTGGRLPVLQGTKTEHAVNLSQLPGTSQTMQNMTSSRAMSTVYTNNEPNPIVVGVYGTMNTSSTAMLAVLNGYTAVPLTGAQVQSLPGDSSLIFEVPSGWTYEVYPSSGSVTAFTWMERR